MKEDFATMEKTISKKLIAGLCALSAGLILASCDAITATPKSYNDPIVTGTNTTDKENLMGKIYDAVATDRNTKIVSDILDEVAVKKFGSYNEILEANKSEDAKKAYIVKYSKTFVLSTDGSHKGATAEQIQLHRFDTFYKDIKDRISESFYNEITSGSYNDEEGRFDEGKLWMAHYHEFYDLGKKAEAQANKFFVTNALTKENAIDKLAGVYSNNEGGRGYIEEKVYPQIIKDKLVEDYALTDAYSSLGRAYARKVSYIKVSYEDHVIPWKILKNFAASHIQSEATTIDFEIVAKALKGLEKIGDFKANTGDGVQALATDSASYSLLKSALGDPVSVLDDKDDTANCIKVDTAIKLGDVELIPVGDYYKDTKLGELIVSFKKAVRAEEAGRFPTSTDKAELDKFLASGKSKEYGLREKLISLSKEDYTTDGWYVKNGGLSELPSELRDRLFNINVANTLDDETKLIKETSANMGAYEKDKDGNPLKRLPYLRNIYGKKLVIPAKSQSYADNPYNYVYQDVDGKAFYIVQVLEAPSTPKLNVESDVSYEKVDPYKTEDIAKQVAKVLGTKDSYITDAYTKYLEKYTFTFYETSLYEHFQSEYPDLFDDED